LSVNRHTGGTLDATCVSGFEMVCRLIGRPIKRNVKRKHFDGSSMVERFSAFSPGDLFPWEF
jgi:hypothetical protein